MKLFWIDPDDSKLAISIRDPDLKLDNGLARVSNFDLNPNNNIFHFHPISFAVFPFVKRNYNPSKNSRKFILLAWWLSFLICLHKERRCLEYSSCLIEEQDGVNHLVV